MGDISQQPLIAVVQDAQVLNTCHRKDLYDVSWGIPKPLNLLFKNGIKI